MTQAPGEQIERLGTFRRARTLFHLRGVPVRVDSSWLVIAVVVAALFFQRMGLSAPDAGAVELIAGAIAASLLFFLSILAHELGHAFTSLDRDIPVLGITLFLMGGVTESTREAASAKDEFVIVGIGPFISLVLAALFGLLHIPFADVQPVGMVLGYMGWTNLLLAIFNVVPGYPLDGGRLLRAIIWGITGRQHRATRWAARVGQLFAIAFGLFGLWMSVDSGGLSGLWNIAIAAFLFKGATDSHRRARAQERLAGRTARNVMGTVPPTLDPSASIAEVIEDVQRRPSLLWPVGRPVRAVVTLPDFDAVPAHLWDEVTVGAVASPADGAVIAPDASMDEILTAIASAPRAMLIVADGGEPVGLITPSLLAEPLEV